MPQDFSQIGSYLLVLLIVFAVYRRLRRSFGRQKLRPGRIALRVVLFAVIGVALAPMALRSAAFALAAAAGLTAGLLLAVWGASRTSFEGVGKERSYVPHTYTGIAVSLLFIGRVAFRVLQVYGYGAVAPGEPAFPPAGPRLGAAAYVSSPLTLGLFFVLVGYYVCYLGFILWKSKQLDFREANNPPPVGADSGAPL